jgi:hypothetical protein
MAVLKAGSVNREEYRSLCYLSFYKADWDFDIIFAEANGARPRLNYTKMDLLNHSDSKIFTSRHIAVHETLEAYRITQGVQLFDAHDWTATLGFPGFDKEKWNHNTGCENGYCTGQVIDYSGKGVTLRIWFRFNKPQNDPGENNSIPLAKMDIFHAGVIKP